MLDLNRIAKIGLGKKKALYFTRFKFETVRILTVTGKHMSLEK